MERTWNGVSRWSRLNHSPLLVFYEVTRACDLSCQHCRALAQRARDPNELDFALSTRLIEQLRGFPDPPHLVLTGGDPLKRPDAFELVRHAVRMGLATSLTPAATELADRSAFLRLAAAGLERIAVSLDAADAKTHDRFRGVEGSFSRTLQMIDDSRRAGLPVQVNSTLIPENLGQLDRMAELLSTLDVAMWSVFFLVPTGRGTNGARLQPEDYERAFAQLWGHSQSKPFRIKTTAAPHYRRFMALARRTDAGSSNRLRYDSPGLNDGKGVMFISHAGLIHPSGFLPVVCGIFPFDSVIDVYQKSPVFCRLRDADQLQGKCGACEFRRICGGSRARAYAITSNPLAAEPDCSYQPQGWSEPV